MSETDGGAAINYFNILGHSMGVHYSILISNMDCIVPKKGTMPGVGRVN